MLEPVVLKAASGSSQVLMYYNSVLQIDSVVQKTAGCLVHSRTTT